MQIDASSKTYVYTVAENNSTVIIACNECMHTLCVNIVHVRMLTHIVMRSYNLVDCVRTVPLIFMVFLGEIA